MSKINAAILGASGYTGGELIRLLLGHSSAEIRYITAERHAGKSISDVFPHLSGLLDLELKKLDPDDIPDYIDVVFLALPHGTSAEIVKVLYERGLKIVDLGADFRLNIKNYSEWYGEHPCSELIENAVYGASELFKDSIAESNLVANPGCYPISSILPLAPLIKSGIIEQEGIIIDSKSGVSGAGRAPSLDLHFSEVSEGFKAYKVGNHRHTPEIDQKLSDYTGKEINVTFTPHLIPIDRGILSTIYVKTKDAVSTEALVDELKGFYNECPFIRVYEDGTFPNTAYVRGSNFCDIGAISKPGSKSAIIVSAIDNLVKGASGQAVQNMNIMMDLPETEGLEVNPIFP